MDDRRGQEIYLHHVSLYISFGPLIYEKLTGLLLQISQSIKLRAVGRASYSLARTPNVFILRTVLA